MQKLVNGDLHEFVECGYEVRESAGLLQVKTPEGWKSAAVARSSGQVLVSYLGRQYTISPAPKTRATGAGQRPSGQLKAAIPGVVVAVNVAEGELVQKGAALLVLEAMKTQIPVTAPFAARVQILRVMVGDQVKASDLLAVLEESADT